MGSYFSRDGGTIVDDRSIGQDKVRTKSYSSCTSNIKVNQTSTITGLYNYHEFIMRVTCNSSL